MEILRFNGKLIVCFSAKEIVSLLILKFFHQLFSNEELKNEPYDSKKVSDFIKELSRQSINSKDYEFYTGILDLYEFFEKNCKLCFYLKNSFNPRTDQITSIDEIYCYRDDPPDIIVRHKGSFYEFELKRYRNEFNLDKLSNFLKKKIIQHYSGKQNFLVILQLKPHSNIDLDIFRQLHEVLKCEKNQPGIIGFSFNKDNKEIILIRILPELNISKRPYNEFNSFTDILNPE